METGRMLLVSGHLFEWTAVGGIGASAYPLPVCGVASFFFLCTLGGFFFKAHPSKSWSRQNHCLPLLEPSSRLPLLHCGIDSSLLFGLVFLLLMSSVSTAMPSWFCFVGFLVCLWHGFLRIENVTLFPWYP